MSGDAQQLSDAATPPGERSAGVALVVGSILAVAFMAFHPTVHGHGMVDFVAEFQRQTDVNKLVHGSLIGLMVVLFHGFAGLASRLGMNTFCGRGGLIVYGLGALAGIA